MTRLVNEPTNFVSEMLDGFLNAHASLVRRADGGVVRSTITESGKVAVVIGGGSGHYPAFAALVGPGMADAAAVGDIFASPSTTQVVSVSRAAQRDAGVLLTFGNYAGDVLNFTAAAERLRAMDIPVVVLPVTDDIASAPAGQESMRRGTAGDLVVFKIAGAAAERGYSLATVSVLASRANSLTRTLGIAFAGCTLPGDSEPLFTVPDGHIAIGLGVHGEPGISEEPFKNAQQVADIFVSRLLAERPVSSGSRVVALLNGLGSTKQEELFVLWSSIKDLLADAKVDVADVQVGELCTSLDMAGCSLTLTWLDDELLELWQDDADSPAFRYGYPTRHQLDPSPVPDTSASVAEITESTPDSHEAALLISNGLDRVVATLAEHESELGALDAIAGDGDHGRGMLRGATAAAQVARVMAQQGAGAATTLVAAGEAWGDRAGGTSGALWGIALVAAGRQFSDSSGITEEMVLGAISAGIDAIQEAGGAEPGDKTIVDALLPFRDSLLNSHNSGQSLSQAWDAASSAASEAAEGTAKIAARKGRARVLSDKSLGTPDPGAISFVLIMKAIYHQGDPS